jgi:membrane protease YdiL (CAAX protease family)
MILFFLVFYLPGYLWTQQKILDNAAETLQSYMLQFLTVAVPQILLLLYVLYLRAESSQPASLGLRDFGLHRFKARDLLYALAIFAGLSLILTLLGFILTLFPESGRSLFSSGFRWKLEDPRLIPLVLLFCLVTGYREELYFRSYLITRFRQLRLPLAIGIGLSTVLFSAGHTYQGLAGLSVALIQGLYFSILFVRLKNIHPLAIAHGLYNTLVLVISLFFDPENIAAGWLP